MTYNINEINDCTCCESVMAIVSDDPELNT